MLGAIIGDTVGSVYEFHNIKTTDFPLFSPQCDYTDDSIMTIAVADWLLTDPQHGMDTLEASFLDFAKKYPAYHIINLDKLTYAGNLDNLRECEGMPNYTFIQGAQDIIEYPLSKVIP